jgi:hypothetical protein
MAASKTPRRRRPGGGARRDAAPASAAVRAAKQIVQALTEAGARFALIGGHAVTARTEPRFTEDVDLAVSVRDDAEAQQLVFALTQIGWAMRNVIEPTGTGRLATVRLSPPRGEPGILVDLLFASSGIEPEIVEGATSMRVLGLESLSVAAVGHLIAMKVLSESPRRLQDRIDLGKLLEVADEKDPRPWQQPDRQDHQGCR